MTTSFIASRRVISLFAIALLGTTCAASVLASDKAAALERERQAHERQVPFLAKHPPKAPLAVEKEPPAPPALIENGQAPFRANQYKFANQIQVTAGGKTSHLYAGALASDPGQGVIVVLQLSDDRAQVHGPFVIKAPAGAGSAKFAALNGQTALIVTENGQSVSAPVGKLIAGVSPF